MTAICIKEGQSTDGRYWREDLNTLIDVPDDSPRDRFQPAELDENGNIRPLDEKECLQMMGQAVPSSVTDVTSEEEDLETMTKGDLIILAAGYNIEGADKMTKPRLVSAIIAAREGVSLET